MTEKFRSHDETERLFALTSALERDMAIISEAMIEKNPDADWLFISDKQRRESAIQRFSIRYSGLNYRENAKYAPSCMDFAAHIQIWIKHKKTLSMEARKEIDLLNNAIEDFLTEARNSISHYGDMKNFGLPRRYIETQDYCYEAVDRRPTIYRETRRVIYSEDNDLIPEGVSELGSNTILNNLDKPEHIGTGFIGRENLIKAVKEKLEKSNIVTIWGQGGTGKTALALKVAWDIIENANNNENLKEFDVIAYMSLKNQMYSIDGGVTKFGESSPDVDFLKKGLISGELGELLIPILDLCKEFPTLVIIDNLESINYKSEEVIEFIDQLRYTQSDSGKRTKIIITTRRSLGDFSGPVECTEMTVSEKEEYFLKLVKLNRIESLINEEEHIIRDYAVKNFESRRPWDIYWAGKYLEQKGDLKDFQKNRIEIIAYCLNTAVETLEEHQRKTLIAISALSDPSLSDLELIKYEIGTSQEIDTEDVLIVLEKNALIRKRLAKSTTSSVYKTNPGVTEYLVTISVTGQKLFIRNITNIIQSQSKYEPKKYQSIFNITHMSDIGDDMERSKVAANLVRIISTAISRMESNDHNFDDLIIKVKTLNEISKDYFEIGRVIAWLEWNKSNFLKQGLVPPNAEKEYKKAFKIGGEDNNKLRYFYATYLLEFRQYQDAINNYEKLDKKYHSDTLFKTQYQKALFWRAYELNNTKADELFKQSKSIVKESINNFKENKDEQRFRDNSRIIDQFLHLHLQRRFTDHMGAFEKRSQKGKPYYQYVPIQMSEIQKIEKINQVIEELEWITRIEYRRQWGEDRISGTLRKHFFLIVKEIVRVILYIDHSSLEEINSSTFIKAISNITNNDYLKWAQNEIEDIRIFTRNTGEINEYFYEKYHEYCVNKDDKKIHGTLLNQIATAYFVSLDFPKNLKRVYVSKNKVENSMGPINRWVDNLFIEGDKLELIIDDKIESNSENIFPVAKWAKFIN